MGHEQGTASRGSLTGFFRCGVVPKRVALPVDRDYRAIGLVPFWEDYNPAIASAVLRVEAQVLPILGVRDNAQVCLLVVSSVQVTMIDLNLPRGSHDETVEVQCGLLSIATDVCPDIATLVLPVATTRPPSVGRNSLQILIVNQGDATISKNDLSCH
jgi:hypothetical protein